VRPRRCLPRPGASQPRAVQQQQRGRLAATRVPRPGLPSAPKEPL